MTSKAWNEYVDLLVEGNRRKREAAKRASQAAFMMTSRPTATTPAGPVLLAGGPITPAQLAVPTALDIAFEKARAAANARFEAEHQGQLADEQAVAAILGFFQAFESVGPQTSAGALRQDDKPDAAANLILSFL